MSPASVWTGFDPFRCLDAIFFQKQIRDDKSNTANNLWHLWHNDTRLHCCIVCCSKLLIIGRHELALTATVFNMQSINFVQVLAHQSAFLLISMPYLLKTFSLIQIGTCFELRTTFTFLKIIFIKSTTVDSLSTLTWVTLFSICLLNLFEEVTFFKTFIEKTWLIFSALNRAKLQISVP